MQGSRLCPLLPVALLWQSDDAMIVSIHPSNFEPPSALILPLLVLPPFAGTSPSDFQSKLAQPFCSQLLRLTGDSEATCKVVHVVATAGRRLLQVRGACSMV